MSEPEGPGAGDELQFDRVVTDSDPADRQGGVAVPCSACRESISKEYYEVNGHTVCPRCHGAIMAAAETPEGAGPLVAAALCGLGAGVAGAFIYFAVAYFAKLEIGIVAVLIGYMVGYTVRKGAGGGGIRFQILAVAFTYLSIGLAYLPLAVIASANADRAAQTQAASTRPVAATERAAESRPKPAVAFVMLVAFTAALPILVVFGGLPSSLISAVIMLIGMRQAWRMTGAPAMTVFGPYQVGTVSPSEPV